MNNSSPFQIAAMSAILLTGIYLLWNGPTNTPGTITTIAEFELIGPIVLRHVFGGFLIYLGFQGFKGRF